MTAVVFRLWLLLSLFLPGSSSDRSVRVIDLTRPIKSSHGSIDMLPSVYRLEEPIRDDARVLVNTIDVRNTRQATSALLPRDFEKIVIGGIDALQGRLAHAFIAPLPKPSEGRRRYTWSHKDFSRVTPHSAVILMDTDGIDENEKHDDDLLTPEAVDCLVNDKKISVLITNHRYIDGRRTEWKKNVTSLELTFLNNGVMLVVSAAPLSALDAAAMSASVAPVDAFRHRRSDDENFGSFFYVYFHILQPDHTIPICLAAVTLLNFTSNKPTSLAHKWYAKDTSTKFIPMWPGTHKPTVKVTMSSRSRPMLFSEQKMATDSDNSIFYNEPRFSSHRKGQRPPRPNVRMKFAEHFGTHIEVPFHMLPNGTAMSAVHKSRFFSDCCFKVDLSQRILLGKESWATKDGISINDYNNYSQAGGGSRRQCLPLFYTGNSKHWQNTSMYVNKMTFPGISQQLASTLLESSDSKNAGIGIDTLSIDPGSSANLPSHIIAAANDAFVLENLANLDKLPDRGQPIPLKIEGGSGSPATVIAFLGEFDGYSSYSASYLSSSTRPASFNRNYLPTILVWPVLYTIS